MPYVFRYTEFNGSSGRVEASLELLEKTEKELTDLLNSMLKGKPTLTARVEYVPELRVKRVIWSAFRGYVVQTMDRELELGPRPGRLVLGLSKNQDGDLDYALFFCHPGEVSGSQNARYLSFGECSRQQVLRMYNASMDMVEASLKIGTFDVDRISASEQDSYKAKRARWQAAWASSWRATFPGSGEKAGPEVELYCSLFGLDPQAGMSEIGAATIPLLLHWRQHLDAPFEPLQREAHLKVAWLHDLQFRLTGQEKSQNQREYEHHVEIMKQLQQPAMDTPADCTRTAWNLLIVGEPERALEAAQAAVDGDKGSAMARAAMGEACFRLGRHVDAVQHYRQAVSLEPLAPEYLYGLGTVLLAVGAFSDAVQTSKQALAMAPEHPRYRYFAFQTSLAAGSLGEGRRRDADTGTTSYIRRLGFEPGGTRFLCHSGKEMQLWDAEENRVLQKWAVQFRDAHPVWSPDGQLAAWQASEYNTTIHRTSEWKVAATLEVEQPKQGGFFAKFARALDIYNGHRLAFSADGTQILTLRLFGKSVWVWDLATRTRIREIEVGDLYSACEMALSPDGKLLALAGSAGNISVVAFETGERMFLLKVKQTETLAFSPDGTLLATASQDGTVQVWLSSCGLLLWTLRESHPQGRVSLAFSPDGGLLVVGAENGPTAFWRMMDGRSIPAPRGIDTGITQVAMAPHSPVLLCGHSEGNLLSYTFSSK
ncbi:MAG: WD40 repeat domain-containing protein [Bacillota bacterium]